MTPLRYLDSADHEAVAALARTVAEHDGVEALGEATLLNAASGEPGPYRFILVREHSVDPTSPLIAVAHLDVASEDEGGSESAVGVELAVLPEHRRQGLGTNLANLILETHPTARFWAHGYLPEAQSFADSLDLELVRELWKMSRPTEGIEPSTPADVNMPEGFTWRTFDPESESDAAAWLEVNALAFAYHPEQGRMTRADLKARFGESWFDPAGFFLVHKTNEDGSEGALAAFHWTKIPEPGTPDTPGEVYVVGVHPDLQGHGLGRVATDLGLAHLVERGVPTIDLYVEGDNTAAIATYRRAGFERSSLDVQLARLDTTTTPTTSNDALDNSRGPEHDESTDEKGHPTHGDESHETGISTAVDEPEHGTSGGGRRRRTPDSRFVPLPQPDAAPAELPSDRFLDRELSWLAFNERVMQMAEDPAVPLLERVNFLSIFASNLDEFFMVRVAGLKRRIVTGLAVRSASGLEPRELLDLLHTVSSDLQERHAALFAEQISPALAKEGITIRHWDGLGHEDRVRLGKWFDESVFPVLTPLAVDPAHPFPYISGLSLNMAVVLDNLETGNEHFARLKIPPLLPRLVMLEDEKDDPHSAGFVPLEEVIAAHLDRLFPGMNVREHFTFRVTRNEDLEVEEDDAENLLTALEKELTRRRFGPPVRLEVESEMSSHVMDLLTREMHIHPKEVRRLPAPLDLRSLGAVYDLERTELKYPRFVPRTHGDLARVESSNAPKMFSAIRDRDVLVQHPYDSFSTSVQAFVEQAAADPNVLAIRQTLYRTSGDSPVIDALIDAADAGKQVLAVVEIKARFDEQNNIEWARKLEHAGVHVVYGVVGLKTHCKLSQVVRREQGGLVRYCHIGTGNYHPKTARMYEDYGLFTRDETVAEDITKLFNQLSGWAPATTFSRLLVAPRTVRTGLLALIEEQIERAQAGLEAYVGIKVNSIVDEAVIDQLYRAGQAGVRVEVLVRGICSLRPGVPGMSENIQVRSIIGRFLEHSRVFCFGPRAERIAYIGSADMMHRNLDRRVEALVQLTDPRHVDQVSDLIELGMSESTASYHLRGDGRWSRHYAADNGEPLTDMQAALIAEHASRRRTTRS